MQKLQWLRSIFLSPAPHHADMLGDNLGQHISRRFGLVQSGESRFWIARYQPEPDRHALLYMTCHTQAVDKVVIDHTGCHEWSRTRSTMRV